MLGQNFGCLSLSGDNMMTVKAKCLVYNCKTHKLKIVEKEMPVFPEPKPTPSKDETVLYRLLKHMSRAVPLPIYIGERTAEFEEPVMVTKFKIKANTGGTWTAYNGSDKVGYGTFVAGSEVIQLSKEVTKIEASTDIVAVWIPVVTAPADKVLTEFMKIYESTFISPSKPTKEG